MKKIFFSVAVSFALFVVNAQDTSSAKISPLFSNIDPNTYAGDPFIKYGSDGTGASQGGSNQEIKEIDWNYSTMLKHGASPHITILFKDGNSANTAYMGYSLSPGEYGAYFRAGKIYKFDGKNISDVTSIPKNLYNSNDVSSSTTVASTPNPNTEGFAKGVAPTSKDKLELIDNAAGYFVKVTHANGKDTLYNVMKLGQAEKGMGIYISKSPDKDDPANYTQFTFSPNGNSANPMPAVSAKQLLRLGGNGKN